MGSPVPGIVPAECALESGKTIVKVGIPAGFRILSFCNPLLDATLWYSVAEREGLVGLVLLGLPA